MIITYLGKRFLKIQYGDTVIGVNPPSKDSSWSKKLSNFGADIALSTSSDPDAAGASNLVHGDRTPFVIDGPGSYEAKGVFISGGFLGENKKRRENAYSISLEGMTIAVLGAPSETTIPGDTRELLSNNDILILPLSSLPAKDAYKLALSLEPMVIVPVDYDAETLKAFIKEAGSDKPESVEKLTIKKKDLEGKDGTIIIVDPQIS